VCEREREREITGIVRLFIDFLSQTLYFNLNSLGWNSDTLSICHTHVRLEFGRLK